MRVHEPTSQCTPLVVIILGYLWWRTVILAPKELLLSVSCWATCQIKQCQRSPVRCYHTSFMQYMSSAYQIIIISLQRGYDNNLISRTDILHETSVVTPHWWALALFYLASGSTRDTKQQLFWSKDYGPPPEIAKYDHHQRCALWCGFMNSHRVNGSPTRVCRLGQ